MSRVLVVGSVAFDSVETPFGEVDDALGGSALYFSNSASFFTGVDLVAVVGQDFPDEPIDRLRDRGVDTDGLLRTDGETFRWEGRYGYDLNEPDTLDTQLNVFGDFHPDLPEDYRDDDYVFLANIDPDLQLEVLDQVRDPEFVALDTMNMWIDTKRDALEEVLGHVDLLTINEVEARQLADEANIVQAAKKIRQMGPSMLAIKRGEYGSLLFTPDTIFFAPAYPLEEVYDPTGAGDTFAGGALGYLAARDDVSEDRLRQATIVGGVMASFCVEEFSLGGLEELDEEAIWQRFEQVERLVDFDTIEALD
ncbi:MAG: PfkB family carbohydrate kinase [Bradymonadaceae bacterium]